MSKLSVWSVSFSYIKEGDTKARPFNRSMFVVARSLERALNLAKVHCLVNRHQDPVFYSITHHGKVALIDYDTPAEEEE